MTKKTKFKLFPEYCDRLIFIGSIALAIFGSFMILSAEMGESSADLTILSKTALKQSAYLIVGIIALYLVCVLRLVRFNIHTIWVGYFVVLGLLIITRAFTPVGGAYGWIWFGGFSFQPSELAKFYIILFASKIFEIDDPSKNLNNFKVYALCAFAYIIIVVFLQNDFGSAVVIGGIAYVCALVAPYKEYKKIQNWMMIVLVAGLVAVLFILSNTGTKLVEMLGDSYRIKRFLASANPFAYQYDSGYHLVMSLVSFATGGLFGLGYGKSIHKFMNFPNPSTDFILPVVVEEMGFVFGLIPIIILFLMIVIPLAYHSLKCEYARGKIVMAGAFMYFVLHFVLNVGGVSGIIPLTGVPLLLVSSGGTSLVISLASLGMAEGEICNYRKIRKIKNENNSRQV